MADANKARYTFPFIEPSLALGSYGEHGWKTFEAVHGSTVR
jgi:hypothetical protein